jgi:DNA-binding NarL/FixJ family response regulator
MAGTLRVVIADDHPGYRAGLVAAIRAHEGLELVGTAADGPDAIRLIRALRPDVAVLDLRMPGLGGLDVCAQVTETGTARHVVILTMFVDGQLRSQAREAGARICLSKQELQAREICDELLRLARAPGSDEE